MAAMRIEEIRKLPVGKVMRKKSISVRPGDSVSRVARLLTSVTLSEVPVVDNDKFVGVVFEHDLLKALIEPSSLSAGDIMMEPMGGISFSPRKASDVMRRPRVSLSPHDTVGFAAKVMFKTRTSVLPVAEKGRIVGRVFEDDLIRLLAKAGQ
jgi:predicted transcriptional regulator